MEFGSYQHTDTWFDYELKMITLRSNELSEAIAPAIVIVIELIR